MCVIFTCIHTFVRVSVYKQQKRQPETEREPGRQTDRLANRQPGGRTDRPQEESPATAIGRKDKQAQMTPNRPTSIAHAPAPRPRARAPGEVDQEVPRRPSPRLQSPRPARRPKARRELVSERGRTQLRTSKCRPTRTTDECGGDNKTFLLGINETSASFSHPLPFPSALPIPLP